MNVTPIRLCESTVMCKIRGSYCGIQNTVFSDRTFYIFALGSNLKRKLIRPS